MLTSTNSPRLPPSSWPAACACACAAGAAISWLRVGAAAANAVIRNAVRRLTLPVMGGVPFLPRPAELAERGSNARSQQYPDRPQGGMRVEAARILHALMQRFGGWPFILSNLKTLLERGAP